MNEQVLATKKAIVEELNGRLLGANCAVVVGYQGLTVKELNELRDGLKKAGAQVEVQKNTLMRRAVDAEGYSSLDKLLTGQNALVTCSDAIAALPVLFKFAKNNKALVVKGGVVEKTFCETERLSDLAKLGSREGALSMLLSVLQAPVRNLAVDLKSISEARN